MRCILFAALIATGPLCVSAQSFNLSVDWNDVSNPNGPWSYISEGQLAASGIRGGDTFSIPVPIWLTPGTSTSHIGWSKANGGEAALGFDLQIGDIYAHVEGSSPVSIRWTASSPVSVEITGGTWMLRDIGRGNSWTLLAHVGLVDTPLGNGNISSGDSYSRANPQSIGGAIELGSGDWIEITFIGSDYFGFALEVTAVPEPASIPLLAGIGALGALILIRRDRLSVR